MTPEKLADLEAALKSAWPNERPISLVALRCNAEAIFFALEKAWRERDEAQRERNELAEELAFIEEEYGKAPVDELTGDAARLKVAVLTKERNEWSLFAKRAIKERDELKAQLDAELPAAWREDIDSLNRLLEQSNKERDTARSEFFRARDDMRSAQRERDEALLEKRAIYGAISVMARYLGMDATELICNPSRVLESEAAAVKERDEARAALRMLWADVKALALSGETCAAVKAVLGNTEPNNTRED